MVAGPSSASGPAGTQVTAAVTTASFTPTANAFIVVVVGSTGSAAATGALTTAAISSTHSAGTFGAWTIQQSNGGGASRSGVFVFYCFAGASPGAGTLTLTLGAAPTDAVIQVLEFTGVDTTTPVVGVATTGVATSTASVTVGATPTTSDYLFGAVCSRNDNDGFTPGSGFTAFTQYFHGSPVASVLIEYQTGTTSTTVDVSSSNTVWTTLVGFIIKNAAAGATPKHKVLVVSTWTDSIRRTYNGSTWTDTVTSIR